MAAWRMIRLNVLSRGSGCGEGFLPVGGACGRRFQGNKGKVSLIFRAEGGLEPEAAGRHQIDRHHHVPYCTFTYVKRCGYMVS